MDVPTIKCVVASVASSLIGSGGLFYFAFSRKLERLKHDLQSELERKSVVYQHQKDAFRKIIEAMNRVVRKIEENAEGDGGDWRPIGSREHNEFRNTVAAERLFIDSRAERALELFTSATWNAVRDERFTQFADTEAVYRSYDQLRLIANRVAEHFRRCVGLQPGIADPLGDVELLDACCLINRYTFPKLGLPTKSELSLEKHDAAEELVAVARKNLGTLKSELNKLRDALHSGNKAAFYYDPLARIDRYLFLLKSMKA